jgi:hypothetical protein
MSFLALVPRSVWIGLGAALLVAVGIGYVDHKGYSRGKAEVQAEWDTERAHTALVIASLKEKQQQVVTRTVIEYRDRVKVVKEKGDEVIKEIQVLVPLDSPLLAGGVRVAHDAAARGRLPDDPEGTARAASPVETLTVLSTVAENYGTCRAEYEKLVALQTLVSSLEGVKP